MARKRISRREQQMIHALLRGARGYDPVAVQNKIDAEQPPKPPVRKPRRSYRPRSRRL